MIPKTHIQKPTAITGANVDLIVPKSAKSIKRMSYPKFET
jgi:hypothetical protein